MTCDCRYMDYPWSASIMETKILKCEKKVSPPLVKVANNVHESTLGNQTLESVQQHAYLGQLLIEGPTRDKKVYA